MNKKAFYASLRTRGSGVFGTSLTQGQVDGVEAILSECVAEGADLGQAAYILGTAYGETGGAMQPVRENMNYSAKRITEVFSGRRLQGIPAAKLAHNPKLLANTVYGGKFGRDVLGNVAENDGWNFRGGLIGQTTGRYNFKITGSRLGVDFVKNPKLIDDLKVSAKAIVRGMLEGWHGNKRPLSDYVSGAHRDYVGARAIWNGSFEAEKYAGYARAFETALDAGGYQHEPKTPPKAHDSGLGAIIAAIVKALVAFFGRTK